MKWSKIISFLLESKVKKSSKSSKDSIALFPGKFKPPHLGHLHAVKEALKRASKVFIIIARNTNEGSDGTQWTPEKSLKIWNELLKKEGISNKVDVEISKVPSPVLAVYQFLETSPEIKDKDLFFVKSSKDDEEGDKRFKTEALQKSLAKNSHGANTDVIEYKITPLKQSGKVLSSSDIRALSKEQRTMIDPIYESTKNLHTSHLEDLLFEKGYKGFLEAIRNLYGALNILSGKDSSLSLSEKIDGSISILFGKEGNTPFVSYKSGKNIAKSENDIKEMYGDKPNLVPIFSKILSNISPYAQKDTSYQGDLLWGSKSELSKTKDGFSFTPNTITYSINIDSLPDLGIAVHTMYKNGGGGSNMFDAEPLRKGGFFILDPKMKNVKSTVDTNEMKSELNELLKESKVFSTIKNVFEDPALSEYFPIWVNQKVRGGVHSYSDSDFESLLKFTSEKYDKKANEMKTEKGKNGWISKKQNFLNYLNANKEKILKFFVIYNKFINLKNKILKELKGKEQLSGSIEGKPTGEGWVLLSQGGKFVKLVDREDFSTQNFMVSKNRKNKT